MSEKKHIDRLFQEKFKDFETKPSENVWAGIESKMDKPQQKSKTIFPVWLRFASIAAALVLLFTVGNLVFNTKSLDNKPVTVDTENTTNTKLKENNKPFNAAETNTSTAVSKNQNTLNSTGLNSEKESLPATASTTKGKLKNNTKASKAQQNNKYTISAQTTNTTDPVLKANTVSRTRLVENRKIDTNGAANRMASNTSITSNSKTSKVSQDPSENGLETHTNSTVSNSMHSNKTNTDSNHTVNSVANKKTQINNNNINTSKTEAKYALDPNATITDDAVAITNGEKEEKEGDNKIDTDSANSSETIEEALAKIEDLDKKEEEHVNRWSVNANAAPVYYNTLGKGSHIHEQFVNNEKDGEINTSYGVNVGYALNEKLKLRSGINKLNLSYDTANVIVYENVSNTPSSIPLRNIDFIPSSQGESISVLSANSLSIQQVSGILNDRLNAALSQRISYFEVPLELEYKVVNQKFGVNLIGGFSTFILSDNAVVTEVENRKTKIGEANNINDVSFSANAGIGIDYKFSKSLEFNLEPTFKYQINAYSETSGDFRPYIIGVYTGFSYKF